MNFIGRKLSEEREISQLKRKMELVYRVAKSNGISYDELHFEMDELLKKVSGRSVNQIVLYTNVLEMAQTEDLATLEYLYNKFVHEHIYDVRACALMKRLYYKIKMRRGWE